MTTHLDVGIGPQLAAALACKPTIDYLCQDYSDGGGAERDHFPYIDWTAPAAVDCGKCLMVLELWREHGSLKRARKEVGKRFEETSQ